MSKEKNAHSKHYERAASALIEACEDLENRKFQAAVEKLIEYKKAMSILRDQAPYKMAGYILAHHAKNFLVYKTRKKAPITSKMVDQAVQAMMTTASKAAALEIMGNIRARRARAFNGAQVFGGDLLQLSRFCRAGSFDVDQIGTNFDELNTLARRGDAQTFFGPQIGLPGA